MNIRIQLRFMLAIALVIPTVTPGQQSTPLQDVRFCRDADVDPTVVFADVPVDRQTLTTNVHNISGHACLLQGVATPNFSVLEAGHLKQISIKTCWFCKADPGLDQDTVRGHDELVLPAGGSAHFSYTWASRGDSCVEASYISTYLYGNYIAFSIAGWAMHVCSVVDISSLEPGLVPETSSLVTSVEGTTLQVSVTPSPTYSDEYVKLYMQLKFKNSTTLAQHGCPDLYIVTRDASSQAQPPKQFISAQFVSVNSDDYRTVGNDTTGYTFYYDHGTSPSRLSYSGSPSAGQGRLCDRPGEVTSATVSLEASELVSIHHVVWRATSTKTGMPTMLYADASFPILDPNALAPNWGPHVQGIATGLSIDKTTFRFGETIPLHVHWADFEATQPIGSDECREPKPMLEVQDASHHVFQTYSLETGCNGHGWGPFRLEPGKPQHQFVEFVFGKGGYEIRGAKPSIQAPGIYYLTTIWTPPVWKRIEPLLTGLGAANAELGDVYATARSLPVRIEILPAEQSKSK